MTQLATVPNWAAIDAATLTSSGTLPACWLDTWQKKPDLVVIEHDGGASITAAEMLAGVAAVTEWYRSLGLASGARVVLSAGPSIDMIVYYAAALALGLVVVPMNTEYTRAEWEHVVDETAPSLVLTGTEDQQQVLRGLVPNDRTAVVSLPLVKRASASAAIPHAEPGSGDPALICFTSGTTGRPKGAVLTHGNLLASATAVAHAWNWTDDDSLIVALPLFHLHGLGVAVNGSLLVGSRILLQKRFDAAAVLDAVPRATMFFGVPTMYAKLLREPGAERLGELRLCVSGSAPLSHELFRQFEARTGQRVLERYGMTETVMLTSNPYEGDRKAGSVGYALPGVRVRLDPDSSEVLVKGPNVFAGYWGRPAETEAAFSDGWFRTGDIGRAEPDGRLALVGRARDLIITGGYNVYAREVEEALEAHPDVEAAVVVGIPDPEWGEVVAAHVVTALTPAELSSWVEGRLANYKRPRFYAREDAIPVNALGKPQKFLLRTSKLEAVRG